MRRFDAKEPPKPRGTPSSSRSATPSWPPYLRGHPAQRLIPDEEILRLYVEEKLDSSTIGYRAGCSGRTVLEIVRSLGGVVRGRGGHDSGKPLKLTDAEIIQRYRNGVSGTVLAEQAGCGRNRMFRLLHSLGVKTRNATERGAADRMIARTQARLDREKG